MKFQSLIATSMNIFSPAARALLLGASLIFSTSCVSLIAKKHSYSASSPAAKVNGSDIRLQFKPEGTDGGAYSFTAMVVSASIATLDGPFSWRLEALGTPGVHQSLVVHRIHTSTSKTKRSEWFPRQHLGHRADFKTLRDDPKIARAIYSIPGKLVVKPREDGALEIEVDLSVTANGHSQRKLVRFRMNPAEKRQDEMIFLPVEIVQNIGKPLDECDNKSWE